jgi:hypothetical protein
MKIKNKVTSLIKNRLYFSLFWIPVLICSVIAGEHESDLEFIITYILWIGLSIRLWLIEFNRKLIGLYVFLYTAPIMLAVFDFYFKPQSFHNINIDIKFIFTGIAVYSATLLIISLYAVFQRSDANINKKPELA